ncbi:MAG: polysaccharide biosynthesis protein [Bdellovibrionales bacterium]
MRQTKSSPANLTKQKILIFGGTGSLGHALVRRLSDDNQLIIYSRDEAKHWTMRNHLGKDSTVQFEVGDIRDSERVEEIILKWQPTILIIAAALKQVDTCERSPSESILTNIIGIRNIVAAVNRQIDRLPDLETVMMISTDKACAPTNVYGMCKAISERLVTSQSLTMTKPKFVAVRYGNVLESRGSIIPLFRWQAENLDKFTVTHPEMTRFVMTLDESIDLIIATCKGAKSGETWLPRLRAMRIMDLASIFSEKYGKPIDIIGLRPGEKLFEELISGPESVRVRLDGDYYRMAPAHVMPALDAKAFSYGSNDDVLDRPALEAYLNSLNMFGGNMDQFVGIEIDEIAKTKPLKAARS